MNIKHSLVVPCYNEEGNVENFLNEAREAFKGYTDDYEIVFVNDGSRDSTSEKLKKLWKENKDTKIKVISFSRNFGKEAAMYAGLTNSVGEYVTIIDADLQQSPEYAVQMGKILDENLDCDIVAAYQEHRKEGKFISCCKTGFYKVINKFSDVDFVTDASDFRTMRRCVVDTIVALPEYHRFSKGIFSWVGYNTVSIPYEVKARTSGETKWNFTKLLKYALDGMIAYTDLPLRLPLFTGLTMAGISVILLIALLSVDIFSGYVVLAGYYLISVLLFSGGIICVFLGIIGYYLGKIHTQVKQRPIFIAKEILTYEND